MFDCDLIILVYACDTIPKYKRQIDIINATWGKKCEEYTNIKLIYFLGEEKTHLFTDSDKIKYINLVGVNNDYLSASYKQFLGLKYIYENYKPKFIICVGTDTYLNIPKLLLFINNFDYTDCLYIGGHGAERQIGSKMYYFHSGGPGFIITYNTLEKIYKLLNTLMEDWIQVCNINNVGGGLVGACDVAISYYLQQPNINVKIIKPDYLSFTHCNYLGFPCHRHQVNMKTLISCHSMNESSFYDFTQILNKNNHFTNT